MIYFFVNITLIYWQYLMTLFMELMMILVMALIRNHGQGADNHSNGSFLSCHGANDLVMKLLMSGMNLMILVSEQMILVMDLMILVSEQMILVMELVILVSEQMILVMELMILVNKLGILIGN